MKRLFAAVLVLFGLTAAAAACPAWQNPGVQSYATDGQDLWSPNSYNVVAGGDQDLRSCGFNYSGNVISNPDFEFSLSGMGGYGRLNIRVNASCDTVMLVNDANGTWHYNDDGGNGLNAELNIANPQDGVYDIWVGTYGSSTCNATLTLETF